MYSEMRFMEINS